MKHLKLFENIDLENKIKTTVNEITYSNFDSWELEECPFTTEIALVHQKKYIDDMYFEVTNLPKKLTLGEFTNTYNKLYNQAVKTIIEYLENNPSLYHWVEEYDIDIPDWIKQANKYNL